VVPGLIHVDLNHGFARAVVQGLVAGRVWVDQKPAARVAHAWHPYGMSLVWGDELGLAIGTITEHLRAGFYRTQDEWLQIDPRWEHLDWDTLLDATPGDGAQESASSKAQRYSRVNFRFDPKAFEYRRKQAMPPPGWRVRPMSAQEFNLPGIGVTPKAFWRDAAQFLAHGGGWCAECDGEVGAIAFSSFRFDNTLEIGIETLAAYRGRGLALAVAVAMIREILDAGIEPVWSCRKENTPSLELARRLGFSATKVFPYYRLSPPDRR